MDKEDIVQKYTALGLEVEEGFDEPGKVYELHKHETTYLWTVSGSVAVKKAGDDWQTYLASSECVILDGELHEAKVGNDGWQYIAGWNSEEAKKYPD